MVQQTSLFAYEEVKLRLGEKQQAVMRALRALRQATDKDLAAFLHWPINTVTPRRGELAKIGLIAVRGRIVQDGRQAIVWTTTG